MEFRDLLLKRQSVREYEERPVPEEKLTKILKAARLAPSASNRQPWKFVVVREAGKRKELARAANNQSFVGEAPVIITAVATEPERIMTCGVPAYAVDLAIAIEHMALAAADEGLGSCWIGAFSQDRAREVLGIPDKYKVVTVMPLGYAKGERSRRPRKPLNDIRCDEVFKE